MHIFKEFDQENQTFCAVPETKLATNPPQWSRTGAVRNKWYHPILGGEGIHNIALKRGNHARGAADQVNPGLDDCVDGVLWCSSRAVGRGVCNLVFSAGRVDPEIVQTVRSALEG